MDAEWSPKIVSYYELRLYQFTSKLRLIRPSDPNELVMVATSDDFTDFAYISFSKQRLALETSAHNRQYPD